MAKSAPSKPKSPPKPAAPAVKEAKPVKDVAKAATKTEVAKVETKAEGGKPEGARPEGRRDAPRPGKPTDNSFNEAFNGRFRAACLNQHGFRTLADVTENLEAWRRYYNEEPPQGAIGNMVPITLTKSGGVTNPAP